MISPKRVKLGATVRNERGEVGKITRISPNKQSVIVRVGPVIAHWKTKDLH